jgi:hypothetical protein
MENKNIYVSIERALNDYTANLNTTNKKKKEEFIEPKKTDMNIETSSPMDIKNK